MAWKCPDCGFNGNKDDNPHCQSCGYAKIPQAVVLTAIEGGKKISMSLDTTIGKQLLKNLVGDDSRFVTDNQFRITKNKSLGKWLIQHEPSAKNPTFYKGAPLAGEQALEKDAVISIGPEKAKLIVSFKE